MRAPKVSVYYREKRGTYSVRWREQGKQREQTGFNTQEEADEYAVALRRELRNPFSTAHQTPTIGRLLAEWWDAYAATSAIKPGTREVYARCMGLILDSPLADLYSSDLTTAHINQWSQHLDHNDSTVRNMLVVLGSAFTYGVGIGLTQHNPVRGAWRPSQQRRLPIIPTIEEVRLLERHSPEPTAKWRSLLLVSAYCGLRQQEAFALEWGSVTPEKITIQAAMSGSAKRTSTTPKTETGVRQVPVPPFVKPALAEWREQSGGTGLVWPNRAGNHYATSNFHNHTWNDWREHAGVDRKWKHLRHYAASQWAASGASPLQVSRWMGHKSYAFTMDTYGFLFETDTPAVMEALTARYLST